MRVGGGGACGGRTLAAAGGGEPVSTEKRIWNADGWENIWAVRFLVMNRMEDAVAAGDIPILGTLPILGM